MAVKLLFQGIPQFEDSSGNPYTSARLFFYAAGSSTKQNTYSDSTGLTANSNPITLNSSGYPAVSGSIVQIWGTVGQTYKIGLAAPGVDDPPASFIWTADNVSPINDTTVSVDEWVTGPTPTYVSATSFTLVGDQTSAFSEGRRLKITDSGGTKYCTITGSVFAAATTVTVAGDALATPTSAVSYSLVSATNPSISSEMIYRKGTAVVSAATCDIWNTQGDIIHITGSTGPITSFGTAPYTGARKEIIFDSTPTITHNATSLQIPGGVSITAAAGDRAVVRADTTANMIITSYFSTAIGAFLNINGATEDTAPDLAADFVNTYDVSATSTKKVLLGRLGSGVLGTEQATTSGTAIDFTSIPSWVKKIIIQFVGVSTNGSSDMIVQIGDSGGIETSGYLGAVAVVANGAAITAVNKTDGYGVATGIGAASVLHGSATLTLEDATQFTWVCTSMLPQSNAGNIQIGGGSKSTSAALDRVRITMTNGTDAFDAGAINILYE